MAMKVGTFCSSDLVTTDATDTLLEAAEKMSRSHIGALAVLDGDELVGVLSEADLVRAIAEEASLHDTAVEDYMTEDPVCIEPANEVTTAARVMVENGIGYLLVVEHGAPVGIVSRGDLLALGAANTASL